MKTSMVIRPNLLISFLELLGAAFFIIVAKQEGAFSIILWILAIYFLISVIWTMLKFILKKPLLRRKDNVLIIDGVLHKKKVELEGLLIKKVKIFGMLILTLKSRKARVAFSQFDYKKADIVELEAFIKDFYV